MFRGAEENVLTDAVWMPKRAEAGMSSSCRKTGEGPQLLCLIVEARAAWRRQYGFPAWRA